MNTEASSMNRREKTRLHGAFPVRVRGVDASGRPFKLTSLADNVSAGGLYVQLPRAVAWGTRLFAAVRLEQGVTVAARCTVQRVEDRPHGLFGLGVQFTQARLLAA